MSTIKPLVKKKYLLEKFPGKGGWTYAAIPEIPQDRKAPFGWVKVKGSVDHYEINNYKLMPMGNGKLFFPIKAAIRKAIKKEAGDWVQIILYADDSALEIPQAIIDCLQTEPDAYQTFLKFTEGEQKAYLDWIYSSKKEHIQIERIAKMIDRLMNNLKFNNT